MRLPAVIAVLLVSAGCTSTDAPEPVSRLDVEHQPIVGGVTETGYRGVGAFLLDEGGGYAAMCTATHIGDGWFMTAAHCVVGRSASDVQFTPDAEADAYADWYPVRGLHPYSGYDPETASGDIALVEVAGVSSLPTYEYNTTSLSELPDYGSAAITWVGYGLNDGIRETGDGVKRRGSGHINELRMSQYTYLAEGGVMPCRGDSGGPSFATIEGEQRLIGIISSGDETCTEFGIDTRVDAFASWIGDTIDGSGSEDCSITGGDCSGQACWPIAADEFLCQPSEGISEGGACDPDQETWTSALPCEDGTICIQVSEDAHDGECIAFCLGDGDCPGTCRTPIFEDFDDVGVCVPAASGCDIRGGDCGDEACFPTTSGENDCFASEGIATGSDCDPDQESWTALPCTDGAICVGYGSGSSGICLDFCLGSGECRDDETCQIPIFTDVDGIGACVPCTDTDSDGSCASDDCDDSDSSAYPGATERCNDGVDNNCNGETDEGCDDCTDGDADGYCDRSGEDCDDGNADINPSTAEDCGDGVDNDCDGFLDGEDTECGGGDGDADGDVDGDVDSDGDGDGDSDGDSDSSSGRGCRSSVAGSPAEGQGEAALIILSLLGAALALRSRH